MEIMEVASGLKKPVVISLAEKRDFKLLTKKRYFFDWKSIQDSAVVYKLQIPGEEDILGVMELIDVPEEKRIEINLLAVSIENKGKDKIYDRVAGCLIGFACSLADDKYGKDACVSLVPKTILKEHYMQKYQMIDGGRQLYMEGKRLFNIINEYLYA